MAETPTKIDNANGEDETRGIGSSEEEIKMNDIETEKAAGQQSGHQSGDLISKPGVIYEDKNETGFSFEASDEEYDTDLENEERPESFDATGRKLYLSSCKNLEITPVSFFLRHIQDAHVDMKHRGLGPKGAKAMAVSLVINTSITSLNLHDNALEGEGGAYIADMLRENCYIADLDLSSNKLGSRGCQAICDMLQYNVNLLKLNLANNNLTDKDTHYLLETFKGNEKLAWMDLSHNKFSENSGENLGAGITSNDSLEYLNLSWNHLRRKGAIEVANGLRSNCTLKTLDLSFNGFADDGAAAMGEAIRANNTLTELDISNNRINSPGALCIAKGLEGNNTLEVLKIGCNPINGDGIVAIFKAVMNYSDSALSEVHLQDLYLDSECYSVLREVRQIKPDFRVYPLPRTGGKNPLTTIRHQAESHPKQWLEVFGEYDEDKSYKIGRRDFIKGLTTLGFKLDFDETARLLKQLDPRKEDRVSYIDRRLGIQPPVQEEERED